MQHEPQIPARRIGAPRIAASVALALLSLGAIGWLLIERAPEEAAPPPPPPVSIAGQELPLGGDAVADALDLVRRYAQRSVKLTFPDGAAHEIHPARLGAEIDRVRLSALVKDVLDADSALVRAYRDREAGAALSLPVPLRIDAARAIDALVTIKDGVDHPASDAVVNVETRQLEPDKPGFRLDVYDTLAALDDGLQRGASEIAARGERIEPRVKASQLGNVKFDNVLGWFETGYSRSDKYRDRAYNLHQAASKLDGTVLMPGEVFDFNETVGPRDEANGYRVATVIAQGELVDGIGGGTCQVSGTLHGAAFFAGLEVVERAPHTRPSTYIKLGLDAAVAYPTLNLKLRNNFDFPVVLHETVKNGKVRSEVLGPARSRTVTFFRRVDEIEPFTSEERETEDIPEGERVLSQRGVPGFKATVFRIVRDGAYAVRTKTFNHYPATTQIVKVGTGPKDRKLPADDNHPEYKADEYLVLTQEPKGEGSSPAFGENRIAGRSGDNGWQEKLGMPVFKRSEESDDND